MSKVRSPSPSAINTTTFCNPPFGSAMTSLVRTGPRCCAAQLGSADMLIGLDSGEVPENFTTPFINAEPVVGAGALGFALTESRLYTPMARVRLRTRKKIFDFILHLREALASHVRK